jgi:hypothetical protein
VTPDAQMGMVPACAVCGGREYEHASVLWPELARDWNLSAEELHYIDVQQGTHCRACRCNVRSIAVARGLLGAIARARRSGACASSRSMRRARCRATSRVPTGTG